MYGLASYYRALQQYMSSMLSSCWVDRDCHRDNMWLWLWSPRLQIRYSILLGLSFQPGCVQNSRLLSLDNLPRGKYVIRKGGSDSSRVNVSKTVCNYFSKTKDQVLGGHYNGFWSTRRSNRLCAKGRGDFAPERTIAHRDWFLGVTGTSLQSGRLAVGTRRPSCALGYYSTKHHWPRSQTLHSPLRDWVS